MTTYSREWHYENCMGRVVCEHEDPHCPHYHSLKGKTVCDCQPKDTYTCQGCGGMYHGYAEVCPGRLPKDTNEQALRESQVDELDEIFKEVLYCLNNNSASNLCSDCVEMRDRAKTVITALRVRDRIDEIDRKIPVMLELFSSADYKRGFQDAMRQCDKYFKERKAELESQLNTGKSK